jgi:hypothetical protein
VPRKVLFIVAVAVIGIVTWLGAISANAGLLDGDGHVDLPGGGGGVDLPGGGGGGGVDLPGGGGVDLPGGGGTIPLPGGGDGGGGGLVPTTPVLPPPDDGTEPPPEGGGGSGDPGRGGNGGRGHGNDSGGGGDRGGEENRAHDGDKPRSGRDITRNPPPLRNSDGTPTLTNPGLTIADFGSAPIGVPNFVIDQFSIPPFLLPIYQACGTQYGIPWQVLASINRIETAFGTNMNVSTAGAQGWMQFIPSTWDMYGVDANNDGRKDPYNPVDAICAAARYLNAAGGADDLRTGIFAYNHADWYVDEVLLYARQYGQLPEDLVGSLTGLAEGARFPVAADSRYADDISEREADRRAKPGEGTGNVSETVTSSPTRRGINIYSREDAPVIAVNDGVIEELGRSRKLGNYIVLRDNYGNRFTYAELGSVSEAYPVPKESKKAKAATPAHAEAPDEPASKLTKDERGGKGAKDKGGKGAKDKRQQAAEPTNTEDTRERLYAFPDRQADVTQEDQAGRLEVVRADALAVYERLDRGSVLHFDRKRMTLAQLEEGSKVVAGTVLGRIGPEHGLAPHVHFSIRPAGSGAPKIDPKPILDGWKLLEATAIYRASGRERRAGPPHVEGAAPAAPARRSEGRDLRVRPPGHPDRPDRPPHPRRALLPLRLRLPPRRHLAEMRPRDPHFVGQRFQPLPRRRRRHRDRQRATDPRQPGPRLDHGDGPAGDPPAPGHDDPRRADLADGPRRTLLRVERPRRPHPRRVLVGRRRPRREGPRERGSDPDAEAVEAAHRPSRRDRQPRGAHRGLGRGDPDQEEAGLRGPPRRIGKRPPPGASGVAAHGYA